jgi:uncharacterized protein YbaP (TraB family)
MKHLGWIILLAAGLCPAQTPSVQTMATPAMWSVKGVHGTVYLFGSIHVMKAGVEWETAKVKAALGASDTIYLEVADIDPDAVQKLQPVVMQMGMDPQNPLSTKIPKADVELIDAAAKSLGAPGEAAFEPMKPWLVYLAMSVLPAIQAGYQPDSGVDQKINAEAKAAGKRVLGFETAEQQLHYISDFPEAEQVELLHQTLVDLPKSAARMDDMVAEWERGDVDKIAEMENGDMKVKHPALYDRLLLKRNEQFADVLAGLLKDPKTGTVFVTIGAAHLAGPESVQKMLEKKGFSAVRVE